MSEERDRLNATVKAASALLKRARKTARVGKEADRVERERLVQADGSDNGDTAPDADTTPLS